MPVSKQMSLCPSKDCDAENPEHLVISQTAAEKMGQAHLGGAYRCEGLRLRLEI
jgi:hypothetical protein